MHLEAIDNDLWYVVENGVPSITPSLNATDVKRFKQLDSQAKNYISIGAQRIPARYFPRIRSQWKESSIV